MFSKLKVATVLELQKKIAAALERDVNTQKFHLKLNEDLIKSVHEQAELTLSPYKPTTNLLSCDEAFASNSEQAFKLYQSYTEKLSRLKKAKTAYEQFMTLIHANKPKVLKDIDSETKTVLRNFYCRFQPYMIEIRTNFNNYDELIIAHFSDKEQTKLQTITTKYFERTEKSMVDSFNELINKFEQRTELYRHLAAEKYRKESQLRILKPDYSTTERTEFLLEHTEYSKAVSELRASLFQLTTLFNKAAQDQLKPVMDKLPFPELKDQNEILAQSRQLLGIKQLFNSLYHLEKITNQLEVLNNKSRQTIYVHHLGQAYSHIIGIIDGAKELYKDPYLAFIGPEIIQRATKVSNILLQKSEPYLVNSDSVILPKTSSLEDKNEVKYSGIWYPLNAFMLIPAQIDKLKSETELTTQERERIQVHTKEVVINIEKIIASTSSYFKLFLQAPVLFDLFQELKARLSQFTNLSHEAVLSNLKEINDELFSKILIETDECEDSVGLLPGQFSGPMKLLLDEFYKGLIEPLGIVSQKNIALFSKQVTIDRRIAALRERKSKAQNQQKIHQHDFALMAKLMESLTTFVKFTRLPPQPIVYEEIINHLIRDFKNALVILDKNSALFTLIKGEIEKSPEIDKVLNSTKNTLAHCKIVFNYYKGLIATNELEIQTTKEKRRYLNVLREQQPSLNRQYIRDYVEVTLNRQIETALDRDIGLMHLQEEYQIKLKEYLENWNKEIVNTTLTADKIDDTLRIKICEKIGCFDYNYYSKYAHLDSVIVTLDQFKNYLIKAETALQNEGSTFENNETLAKKSILIARLEKIAMNKNISVIDRIQKLQEMSVHLQFEETLVACSEPQFFTLEWLTRLVTSLLQLLNLYKPEHIEHYNNVTQALTIEPENQILNRYRLFKTAEGNRRFSLPQLTLFGVDENIQDPDEENEEIELNNHLKVC